MSYFVYRAKHDADIYVGPLDPTKMSEIPKKAYRIFMGQKSRSGVEYDVREFIAWYLKEWKRLRARAWPRADVARKDHSKAYSFSNIELQPVRDNVRERNERCGNPGKSHRQIISDWSGVKRLHATKQDAADYFRVSPKTVYNHCQGRTKNPVGHFNSIPVRFEWAK